MPDLLESFKQKADDIISGINRAGGIRATIEALRKQMAEADRRRAVGRVKAELKRANTQINEMTTAVGLQAVGLHEAGRLNSPELQPLCQHIVDLKVSVGQMEAELAKLEAQAAASAPTGAAASAPTGAAAAAPAADAASDAATCTNCGKPLPADATFCAYCGTAVSKPPEKRFCIRCGSELRPQAKFCSKCGQTVEPLDKS